MRRVLVFVVMLVAAVVGVIAPAEAIERNFAGSAQLDYHFVPTARDAKTFPSAFDGFTMELSGKVAVDFSEHVSANLKLCYGCHGFEADMMYFDVRVADELNFRVGRFSPSFGAFNLRHDPANHRLSDKPLPYDMGRMLRLRAWNMSVLPSPFPDNGIEMNGTKWIGQSFQLDYALYAVSGFKADAQPKDLDFRLSRSPQNYYVDNNGRPTVGARLAGTLKLGESSDATLGASFMGGTYDPENHESYLIMGTDLTLRFDKTSVRFEYLSRRTTFDVTDRNSFKYVIAPEQGDYFMKHGAYAEIEQALTQDLDLIGRIDGLYRVGNIEAASPLSRRASVFRYTLGMAYAIERGLRVKLSTELWEWSAPDVATGKKLDATMHVALTGSF